MTSTLSVQNVADRYGVSEHTVLVWIAHGELRAINVGRHQGARKPRWRITEDALAAFEQMRATTPPLPQLRRRKRPADVIEFY
jgi:excisionase family DNA binding protein